MTRASDEQIAALLSKREAVINRLCAEKKKLELQLDRVNHVIGWVDSWVSNPVGSYSVAALDGLFGMTRDKIAALPGKQGK